MNDQEQTLVVKSLLQAAQDTLRTALALVETLPDVEMAALALDDYIHNPEWLRARALTRLQAGALAQALGEQQSALLGARLMLESASK